jgi:hypothetical protein
VGFGHVFFPYVVFVTHLRWLVILQKWSKIQNIVLGQGGASGNRSQGEASESGVCCDVLSMG